jgi:(2R)-3-sulfolactate dehydrogenase (NADP+)
MTDHILAAAEIAALAEAALLAHGASPGQARPLARAIAAAERDGVHAHGLMYLPTYCSHLACGKVIGTAQPELSRPAPGCIVVDARSGFAHAAIALGLPALVDTARMQGIASLAVRNSYNCGILGHHTEAIAAAGLVGLGFTNAPASIAPWGGRVPVVGTNPWSLAVPDGRGGARLVIDQSASVVAKSEVIRRSKSGAALEPGWAFDVQGRPTTDAAAALGGTMAPAGGYKGVGAALLVEIFAACLTGATLGKDASPFSGPAGGPPRTGQFFIAVAPGPSSGGAFAERFERLAGLVEAEAGGRLPGSRKRAARSRSDADGIAVSGQMMETLASLAKGPPA